MFWSAVLVLVALSFGRVPAGLVKPDVFNEDAISEVSTASERIISGWEAYPGQFPYVASLRLVNSGGGVITCAGSVVHRNWVLTTAVCTAGRISAVVSAGAIDLTARPEYIFETWELWIHPSYNLNNQNIQRTDISILKLQRPLTYSRLVQPIRVQSSINAFANYANLLVTASGWGRLSTNGNTADVLNWVYLRAISNVDCNWAYTFTRIYDTYICTRGFNSTSQSICNGDNGGPLVYVGRDGVPELVGIAAFWSTGACNNRPSGFIRPGPFHSWLTEVTGLDFENLDEEEEVTETPLLSTTEVTESTTTSITITTTPDTVTTTPISIITTPDAITTTSDAIKTTLDAITTTLDAETTTLPPISTTPAAITTTPAAIMTTPDTITTTSATITTTPATVTTTPISIITTPDAITTTTDAIKTTPDAITTTLLPISTTLAAITTTPAAIMTTPDTITTTLFPITTTMAASTTTLPTITTTPISITTTPVTNTTTPDAITTTLPPITTDPTTETTEPDIVESDENYNDSDESESNEDPDISELLNKLQVKIKVKVKVNNNFKKKIKVKKVKKI